MQSVAELAKKQSRTLFDGCPLCGSRAVIEHAVAEDCSQHPLYHPALPKEINWMRCESCQHVYTDGYFTPEAFEHVLGKTQDIQAPGFDWERQRYVSARIVNKVSLCIGNEGRWLDIGFGNGSLMFTAEEFGFEVTGLDLRRSSVDKIRKLGFEAFCEDLESYAFSTGKSTFSVISMADVLEHMPFPTLGLVAARKLLKPTGILFVSMPNYNCAAWRLLDAENKNPYWGEIEHYHNFSRARLYSLLSELNFKPVHYGVSERYRICMEVIARAVK